MPELKNPRHENFVSLFSTGMSAGKAYLAAGYRTKSSDAARAAGNRLLSDVSVATRLAELRPAAASKRAEALQSIVDEDISTTVGRVKGYLARRQLILDVISARAKWPDHQEVPGGSTGLVVTYRECIGGGKYGEYVKRHEVDIPLLRELRELEKQIAIELKQWAERHEDIPFDGDLTKLAPDVAMKMIRQIELRAFNGDEKALEEAKAAALAELNGSVQ